jgi:hypothetical protein
MFLSSDKLLSVYETGFSLLSTNGLEVWSVGRPDPGIHRPLSIDDYQRSMDGSRFAISVAAHKRKVAFNGIAVAHWPSHTIVVYDERCRQHVVALATRATSTDPFALSRDGRTLAVLESSTLSFYKLPEPSCGGK